MGELERLRERSLDLAYEQQAIHGQIRLLNARLAEIFEERQGLIEQIGMIVIDGTYTRTDV